MKKIPLTRGQFAFVDDGDFDRLSRFRWCAASPQDGVFYAVRNRRQSELDADPSLRSERGQRLYLMREVAGVGPHVRVKPINGNALDCQRANIKVVQPSAELAARKSAEKYIQPCFPTADEDEARRHPYRGLYKDYRTITRRGGGILVRSYKAGTVQFFGPYRTAAHAMARRDELEKERRDLGQPPIQYAVKGGSSPIALSSVGVVGAGASDLLEELL